MRPANDTPDSPFTLSGAGASAMPVLIAVPHAGRDYPADELARLRSPQTARLRLEDRLVDKVAAGAARLTGITMIAATVPRALIDLNRSPDDIDWSMIEGTQLPQPAAPGQRWHSGLGLVPRRVPGIGELWRRPLNGEALEARINGVHTPYHAAIEAELAALRSRFGAALLLDLHSMPPLPRSAGQADPARVVIGDRFGRTAAGSLTGCAIATAAHAGFQAALNRPYAGGYVLDRHGNPRRGTHALQIELCRSLYLDAAHDQTGPGLDATVALVAELIARLGETVLAMDARHFRQDWPEAAE